MPGCVKHFKHQIMKPRIVSYMEEDPNYEAAMT